MTAAHIVSIAVNRVQNTPLINKHAVFKIHSLQRKQFIIRKSGLHPTLNFQQLQHKPVDCFQCYTNNLRRDFIYPRVQFSAARYESTK